MIAKATDRLQIKSQNYYLPSSLAPQVLMVVPVYGIREDSMIKIQQSVTTVQQCYSTSQSTKEHILYVY